MQILDYLCELFSIYTLTIAVPMSQKRLAWNAIHSLPFSSQTQSIFLATLTNSPKSSHKHPQPPSPPPKDSQSQSDASHSATCLYATQSTPAAA